jgi:hypothetical protein
MARAMKASASLACLVNQIKESGMFLKMFGGCAVLTCGALTLAGLHSPPHNGCSGARLLAMLCVSQVADGGEGNKLALSGAWGKKGGEVKIGFADERVMKIAPHGDSTVIAIVCDYTVENRTLVKAKVTGFEGTSEQAKEKIAEHLPVGTEFSFQWTTNGDGARLEDVKGDKVESLKAHLEGGFEKK